MYGDNGLRECGYRVNRLVAKSVSTPSVKRDTECRATPRSGGCSPVYSDAEGVPARCSSRDSR